MKHDRTILLLLAILALLSLIACSKNTKDDDTVDLAKEEQQSSSEVESSNNEELSVYNSPESLSPEKDNRVEEPYKKEKVTFTKLKVEVHSNHPASSENFISLIKDPCSSNSLKSVKERSPERDGHGLTGPVSQDSVPSVKSREFSGSIESIEQQPTKNMMKTSKIKLVPHEKRVKGNINTKKIEGDESEVSEEYVHPINPKVGSKKLSRKKKSTRVSPGSLKSTKEPSLERDRHESTDLVSQSSALKSADSPDPIKQQRTREMRENVRAKFDRYQVRIKDNINRRKEIKPEKREMLSEVPEEYVDLISTKIYDRQRRNARNVASKLDKESKKLKRRNKGAFQ